MIIREMMEHEQKRALAHGKETGRVIRAFLAAHRARYRREREQAEWIDLGGES